MSDSKVMTRPKATASAKPSAPAHTSAPQSGQKAINDLYGVITDLIRSAIISNDGLWPPVNRIIYVAKGQFGSLCLPEAGVSELVTWIEVCHDTLALLQGALKQLESYINWLSCAKPEMPPVTTVPSKRAPASIQVTGETSLYQSGFVGKNLVATATYEVENLCDAMLDSVEALDIDTDSQGPCAVLRALSMRTKALNSVCMSHVTEEELDLSHCFRKVYGRAAGDRILDGMLVAFAGNVVVMGGQS
jgi:hypothetical protein